MKIKLNERQVKKLRKYAAPVALAVGLTIGGSTIINTAVDNDVKNLKTNIESEDYLLDNYGSIASSELEELDLTRSEKKLFAKENFAFIQVEEDEIDSSSLEKLTDSTDIGLLVTPTNYNYASIYKTIDKVKELVETYDIKAPILFDISKYMEDDTIRANCLLAEEFCNKLSANGCYVGLYGDLENMKKFSSKFEEVTESKSIDLYDKLIATDTDVESFEEIDYDGIYNMIMLDNGKILTKVDLVKVIKDNNLNSKENFVAEYQYKVSPNEVLSAIASKFNMKASDLAEYNGILNPDSIKSGETITIPNNYTNYTVQEISDNIEKDEEKEVKSSDDETKAEENESLTGLLKGIDVSFYQGKIDWETVKEDIDFAIIRLCDFANPSAEELCELDEQFQRNIDACEKLNIPVGVYYFSRATTPAEAKKEAAFVAKKLTAYSLEYPVYIDLETEYQESMMENNPNGFADMVSSAYDELKGEGYFPGIYCNRRRFSNIEFLSEKYNFWLTSNETYNKDVDLEEFSEQNYQILYMPSDNIDMYQYCAYGKVDGINGDVDINYASKTLTKEIVNKGYNKIKD